MHASVARRAEIPPSWILITWSKMAIFQRKKKKKKTMSKHACSTIDEATKSNQPSHLSCLDLVKD